MHNRRADAWAVRPHDLLWVDAAPVVHGDQALPSWADAAWQQVAPVVVRRAARSAGGVPVGLRGSERHQRCAAHVAESAIVRVVTPEQLAACCAGMDPLPWAVRRPDLPALVVLGMVAPALNAAGLQWGPTGGVGFALASGLPVLRAQSDLDLVVHLDQPPSAETRRVLTAVAAQAICRVDLQIDTGFGGFALREWLATPQQVLLKTDRGPRLVTDPWAAGTAEIVQ
ncbi:phosphoribosyl-dephospho-CoA transferase [Pandoraea terrae]|uniref:Phosphoribosyl-dephospho-CoA transferase n=1 Tax=Pandoraea terrae TaxID=1537710 RepID=A0A5E4T0X8_9BURK|nr:malonate decarboxylase holo-ACP synthase [Pandoraea terrae]VVD81012.1 phosphoribosyl-dephospho-CoA transferase [Pandoraea terrae]